MFTKNSKYAIRAIIFLAANSLDSQRYGAKQMAKELDVPVHFLAKILQELARAGLISSVKGPGGGFFLKEKDQARSLAEILEAIEGPEIFNACVLGFPSCSDQDPCPIHVQVYAYRQGLRYQLAHLSIAELAAKARRENLKI